MKDFQSTPSSIATAQSHRIPARVVAATTACIVLLGIQALILVTSTLGTLDSSAEYSAVHTARRGLVELRKAHGDALASQRGYLLSADAQDAATFEAAIQRWQTTLRELRPLVHASTAPFSGSELAQLEAAGNDAISQMRASMSRASDADDRSGLNKTVGALADRLIARQEARIEALRKAVAHDSRVGIGIVLLTTVLTIAVLLTLHRLLKRYVAARTAAQEALQHVNQQLNAQVDERTAELSSLSQHLIRVSEDEKARIARELHDTLGSNLTAINMDLNWINKRLTDQPELRERLQRALQMLAATVELKHEVIEGLRPSHLDNLGLGFAMRTHCREFTRRSGVPCEVEIREDFDDLSPAWSIVLYRVVQEALTNVTRHARAHSVQVRLTRESDGVRLQVVDDGDGISAGAATRPSSHGLIGMRERLRQVGGTVQFSRGPGQRGTVVNAFIPNSQLTALAV
jgi:signal transduction histidine kinase